MYGYDNNYINALPSSDLREVSIIMAVEEFFNDMEEKGQSLQHGWKVAAEGAAEDHEGEASGPVCAHSMDAEGWRARYEVQDVEG